MIMVGRNVLDIRVSILLSVLALALGGGIPVFGQESPNTVAASRDAAATDKDNNDLPLADVVSTATPSSQYEAFEPTRQSVVRKRSKIE